MFWKKSRKKAREASTPSERPDIRTEEVRNLLGQLEQMNTQMEETRALLKRQEARQEEMLGKQAALLEAVGEVGRESREGSKVLRRQAESVEDLLDTLQEQAEKTSALEVQLQESRRREEALLALACCGREQMELVTDRLAENPAWREQLRMLEREAAKYLRAADMQEIGAEGEPVDYELHQVLEAVETDQAELAGSVARVYRRGRIYRGSVIRQAQVAAYRCTKSQSVSE